MSTKELRTEAQTTAPQIKIAAGLWALGLMTIMATTITWVVVSFWAGDYLAYSKATQDAATAGSGVLSDLENIRTTTAWLLSLQVLGLATFLLGFGFAFGNILHNVRLRGNTMAAVLPALKERKGAGRPGPD